MLVDGKAWMARFRTREAAINVLDNSQLKDFSSARLGKSKYIGKKNS